MSVESINSGITTSVQPPVTSSSVEKVNKGESSLSGSKVETLTEKGENEQINMNDLEGAVEKLNNFVSSSAQRNLSFSIDKDTKDMVVTVKDIQTQEVIKQMPTEEALAVAKQIESMLGLILNDKA